MSNTLFVESPRTTTTTQRRVAPVTPIRSVQGSPAAPAPARVTAAPITPAEQLAAAAPAAPAQGAPARALPAGTAPRGFALYVGLDEQRAQADDRTRDRKKCFLHGVWRAEHGRHAAHGIAGAAGACAGKHERNGDGV